MGAIYLYTASLCVYHMGEFLATSYYHADKVTWESFLINQSKEYGIAITASYVEYMFKFVFNPFYSLMSIAISLMVPFVIIGHVFRIGGLISGGRSFTHRIAYKKKDDHVLVTDGFYSTCRHPGYFGWFVWTVAT